MKHKLFNRRTLIVAACATVLSGCQIIPKTGPSTTGPVAAPTPEPSATALPSDSTHHRIALLVPMKGTNGAVGQSIANATTMALLDTNAENLRITTYDTSSGARIAAQQAVSDGNRLILGPLLANNVPDVLAASQRAGVPIVSFSNDTSVARPNVFIMGQIPEQSVARTAAYAHARGANSFGTLVPQGDYGSRALSSLDNSLRGFGGSLAGVERYRRGNAGIMAAAQRLAKRGRYDAVLIADTSRLSILGAGELRKSDKTSTILGTDLWSLEDNLTRAGAMEGALFAAISDRRFDRFSTSYQSRFGKKPYRIATLGYDAVLLTLRIAKNWRVGRPFPIARLRDRGGFLGLDGAFRFGANGVIERAMEVREIAGGKVLVIDNAPARFKD